METEEGNEREVEGVSVGCGTLVLITTDDHTHARTHARTFF